MTSVQRASSIGASVLLALSCGCGVKTNLISHEELETAEKNAEQVAQKPKPPPLQTPTTKQDMKAPK